MKDWIVDKFNEYRTSRSLWEDKWLRNYEVYKGLHSSDAGMQEEQGNMSTTKNASWKSDISIRMTKTKVLAAVSLVSDMLLKGGKIPFMLKQSSRTRNAMVEMSEEESENIRKNISAFTRLIEEQFEESGFIDQLAKNIYASAMYGVSYMKKDLIDKKYDYFEKGPQGIEHVTGIREFMCFQDVSVFDMYYDISVDFLESPCYIQRSFIEARELFLLMEEGEGYDKEAIKSVLQGTSKSYVSKRNTIRKEDFNNDDIELLEFYGWIPRNKLDDNDVDDYIEGDEVFCKCILANEDLIYFEEQEDDEHPFLQNTWELKVDGDIPDGIVDNIEGLQILYDDFFRNYINNKKLSSNVMIAAKDRFLEDEDALNDISPGKVINITEECDDVRRALQPIQIPDTGQNSLDAINGLEYKIDDMSMIPKIAVGQSAPGSQTAYETSQLVEKAGKYIARSIENYDKNIIKPVVKSLYKYIMVTYEDDSIKGDYSIIPLGFSSYNDKVLKAQSLTQILQLILSNEQFVGEFNVPELGKSIARVNDLDIEQFVKTEEERKREQEEQQNSPQFKMQQELQELELEKVKLELEKIKADTEEKRGLAEEAFQHSRRQESEARMAIEDMKLNYKKLELEFAKLQVDAIGTQSDSVGEGRGTIPKSDLSSIMDINIETPDFVMPLEQTEEQINDNSELMSAPEQLSL